MTKTPELVRRHSVAQACVDSFLGHQLRFGSKDCIKLAAFCLRKHNIAIPALKGVRYASEAEGLEALKAKGYADLTEAVDGVGLPRIPAAMAWPADLVAMPAKEDTPWGASLCVALGNNRLLGLHKGIFCIMQANQFITGWRVISNG